MLLTFATTCVVWQANAVPLSPRPHVTQDVTQEIQETEENKETLETHELPCGRYEFECPPYWTAEK